MFEQRTIGFDAKKQNNKNTTKIEGKGGAPLCGEGRDDWELRVGNAGNAGCAGRGHLALFLSFFL